jgi:tripartite ATP-independent transporter DctP family solute receptor
MALCVMAFVILMAADSASAGVKYRMKEAGVGSEFQPTGYALKELVEWLREKSNGEIELELYYNAQLGGDRQICEGVQIGTIELGGVASSVLAAFVPELTIFDFPYLFKTEAAAQKALDGELGDKLGELLLKKNFRIIGWGTNGYRHVTNNVRPIYSPDDMKGFKIRTMENPMYIDYFKEIGANPTPMSFSELFTALQQKTVDAQENPITIIYPSKLYEVQKYISFTGHAYAVVPFIMSEKYFQKLPKEYQDLIMEGAKIFIKRQRQLTSESDAGFIEDMKKSGVEINELTKEQIDVFAGKAKPVYEKYVNTVGREILDLALKAND